MSKDEVLTLRMGADEKEKIRRAAERRGESMTTFISRALAREAERALKKKEGKRMQSGGACPTYFRIGCEEATRGGTNTYASAAWNLGIHLEELAPDDIEPKEWEAMLDELDNYLKDDDVDAVFAWFRQVLPRCMARVPRRRAAQFFQGIKRAYEENRLFQ